METENEKLQQEMVFAGDPKELVARTRALRENGWIVARLERFTGDGFGAGGIIAFLVRYEPPKTFAELFGTNNEDTIAQGPVS